MTVPITAVPKGTMIDHNILSLKLSLSFNKTIFPYARKYAMNGLYQIDDTKDADTDEYKQQVDSSKPVKIDSTKAKVLRAKVKELSILAGLKTGTEITPEAMYEKLSDTKFLSIVPIEKLDTEQFMTIDRYIKELEKAYSKK